MIIFVFGSGLNVFNEKYKGKPKTAFANMIIHIATAILLGVGICLLP